MYSSFIHSFISDISTASLQVHYHPQAPDSIGILSELTRPSVTCNYVTCNYVTATLHATLHATLQLRYMQLRYMQLRYMQLHARSLMAAGVRFQLVTFNTQHTQPT